MPMHRDDIGARCNSIIRTDFFQVERSEPNVIWHLVDRSVGRSDEPPLKIDAVKRAREIHTVTIMSTEYGYRQKGLCIFVVCYIYLS